MRIKENEIVFWRCYALLENRYIILSGLEINFLFSPNNTNFNVLLYACKKEQILQKKEECKLERRLGYYLTEEEKKEMEEIICKAMERREQSVEGKDGSKLPFESVVVNYNYQKNEIEIGVKTDQGRIYQIMVELCKYCSEFGCCPKEDEGIPFDGMEYDSEKDKKETELEISFQEGRMDALRQLVVDGKLTLEESISYTEMVEQKLQELYESLLWFSVAGDQEESDGLGGKEPVSKSAWHFWKRYIIFEWGEK